MNEQSKKVFAVQRLGLLLIAVAALLSTGRLLAAPTLQNAPSVVVNAPASIQVGVTFTAAVQVQANGQEVDVTDVILEFDPAVLEATGATSTGELDETLFGPEIDNAAGQIRFAAGTFGAARTDTFDMLTVAFEAVSANPATVIDLVPPTNTFTTIPPTLVDATVAVQAAAVGCAPISTLPCADVPVVLPYALTFDGSEGGLKDNNSVDTGFTMVDPPSARLAADGPVSNPAVPGYEPSSFAVDAANDVLTIASNKGIQYAQPSGAGLTSSETNSQINALGVGFNASSPVRIETMLLNPPTFPGKGDSQQAGLWFGLDEDNYVKVAYVNQGNGNAKVQLAVETKESGELVFTEANSANFSQSGISSVTLALEIVPNSNGSSVTAYFATNGSAEAAVGPLAVPSALTAGADHDGDGSTQPVSYAGLFTTHRRAAANASLTFVFDEFELEPLTLACKNKDAFTQINWSQAAPQPIGNSEAQGIVVGGKLYSFGGFDKQKPCCTPTDRAYVYDPAINEWMAIASMPGMPKNDGSGNLRGGTTHTGIATDGELIYFAGGYTAGNSGNGQIFGSKNVWYYDPTTNSYTFLPSLPVPRAAGGLVYLSGKLHFFGGTNIQRTQDTEEHWILDLSNQAAGWQTAAPLPNPRNHIGATPFNGLVWAIGGQIDHDADLTPQDSVHAYDPATDSWTQKADLPVGVNHNSSSSFAVGDRILVLGGQQNHSTSGEQNVQAYDLAIDSWSQLTQMPARRFSGIAGYIDGKLYYSTGNGQATTFVGDPVPSAAPDCLADLSVSKSDDPDPVTVGDDVTYTITVNNAGPEEAVDVVLDDVFSGAAVSNVRISSADVICSGFPCSLGTLASGASTQFTVQVTADEVGTINSEASLTSATSDPDSANSSVTETTTVNDVVQTATLNGTATREGRSDHSGSLTVKLFDDQDALVASYENVSSDASGAFTISGIDAATYQVTVKASNTLQVVQSVAFSAGESAGVDFGEMAAGDAVDDNLVNNADFTVMKNSYFQSNPAADFSGDGLVNNTDFTLLKNNYFESGAGPTE